MKKEMIKNVMIGVLGVIILCLVFALIFVKKADTIVKYKYYNDDLINVNNESFLDIKANILDNRRLIILLTSDENVGSSGNLNVEIYNSENEKINENKSEYFVARNSGSIIEINLPELGENYAGTVKVNVGKENEIDDDNIPDASGLKYEVNKTIGEDNVTNLAIRFTNNKEEIKYFSGTVVAFKDDNIVDFNNFHQENIAANKDFTVNASLTPSIKANGSVPLNYDKLEFYYYISNANDAENAENLDNANA